MDLYFYVLIVLNIFLPLFIASYIYMTRLSRDKRESLYAIIILIFWAIRFFWMFIRSFEIYFDFFTKFISLIFSLLMIFTSLWLERIFPEKSEKIIGRIIKYFHILSLLIMSSLLIPLSILLPTNRELNDINTTIAILIFIFAIIILIEATFRVLHISNSIKSEYFTYYNFAIFIGITLVISGDTIFYWIIYDIVLKHITPVIGFMIILGSMLSARIFPFLMFARTVETGIIIVNSKDRLISYLNNTAKGYISPNLLNKRPNIPFNELWPENKRIEEGFDRTNKEKRTFQVEAMITNYTSNKLQNIQFTFYPLTTEQQSNKIGIMLMNSDEIEFLKQRKDFLIDIVTHDLANVSQALLLALESIKYENIKDNRDRESLELAKEQIHRLEQLVFSTQNLLYIDDISNLPEEIYLDFNKRFMSLIEEKRKIYPNVSIKTEGINDLRGIKTTGNLKASFILLIDSIVDSLKDDQKEIDITTQIDNELKEQKIVFKFRGKGISAELFENFFEENKSAIVAASSSRVNMIVGSTIIQKNGGRIAIEKDKILDLTNIIITLPIFNSNIRDNK